MAGLGYYYLPPMHLITSANSTYYFSKVFRLIGKVIRKEVGLRQPCLVAAESLRAIVSIL